MPDRSNLEDKAMALGLVAVGAALPIYEMVTARVREFGQTPAGKAARITAKSSYIVATAALRGAQKLIDREDKQGPAHKTKAAA